MTALPEFFADKIAIGAGPIPFGVAGYDALDSATNNPPVALLKEDALGTVAGGNDPGTGGTATQTGAAHGRKKFRFCINNGTNTGAIASGDIVYAADSFYTQASTSLTDGARNWILGCGAQGGISNGNKGWLQITGYLLVNTGANVVAAGDIVIASAVAKVGITVAAGTAPTFLPIGPALAANSGGTTAVHLMIPE